MTNRRILLIQPQLGVIDEVTRSAPLGLLAIARELHQRYPVTIIDQRLPDWGQQLLAQLQEPPLCIGITCMTGLQVRYACATARAIREICPAPIVFGGVHPSLTVRQALTEPYIDFVVIGEGDRTFALLVEALASAQPYRDIPGIAYREADGTVVCNDPPPPLPLDLLPPLPYHLIDINDYRGLSAQNRGNAFNLEVGRGCVHDCSYCYNPHFNRRRWRGLSADAIITQITLLEQQYHLNGFFFVDDSFMTDTQRLWRLVELLRTYPRRIEWCCEANLTDLMRLTPAEWQALRSSGLQWISVGVESASAAIQQQVRKPIDRGVLLTVMEAADRHGIHLKFNFMTGFAGESRDDIRESCALALTLIKRASNSMVQPFYICVPSPGSAYYVETANRLFTPPVAYADWYRFDPFFIYRELPWLQHPPGDTAAMVMYTSFFIDDKIVYNSPATARGLLVRLLGICYRPVARWRFRSLRNTLFIERFAFEWYHALQWRLFQRMLRRLAQHALRAGR